MSKKNLNVPNLRFPEFKEEWEEKKLKDIATFYSGGTPLTSKKEYFDGNIPFIRSGEINSDKTEQFISELGLKNSSAKMVEVGDVLYALYGATSGEVGISKIKGAINQAVLCIKTDNDQYFLASYLRYKKEDITKTYLQGGQGNLSAEIIKNLKISFPQTQEQKKIADFLFALDSKIQTQKKIIEELNVFKKGIAQKIFSQQLRFKDDNGNDFPEWESKMLGEVLDYEQPTKYLVATTEYDDSFKTPVVTAGKTFILGYTNEEENIFEKEKLPVIIFDDFTTASQFVDFPFKAKSSAMKILKAQKGSDIKFIFEAMQMISYETGGHGRHWISVFSNLEISLPSLLEQQKIANFLSSIDSKIDTENQILQKLEEQKKYFLANLFI